MVRGAPGCACPAEELHHDELVAVALAPVVAALLAVLAGRPADAGDAAAVALLFGMLLAGSLEDFRGCGRRAVVVCDNAPGQGGKQAFEDRTERRGL